MYVGHTDGDRRQPLLSHLQGVSALAGDFADSFGARELGELLGLCHDIGKYAPDAQKRLLEDGPRVDHSTAGAQELQKLGCIPFAYCVAGHHSGLPDGGSRADTEEDGTLYARLKKQKIGDYAAFRTELSFNRPANPNIRSIGRDGFTLAFLIRMLYSCLVDADFLDTEAFMQQGTIERGGYACIAELNVRLEQYLQRFREPKTELHRMRNSILENCQRRAEDEPGLFSLTVPTGGGKTIASLAFALRHAKRYGMERVIYVIPYTSIIEQTAQVFSDILGAEQVVEHHSNVDYNNNESGKRRNYLASENWDAPVIVTTGVQFFESLFACRSSKCRKLHNIANSVIIFDEAQMLPTPFLSPCVQAITELVCNYRATAVLCTATQPALDKLFPQELRRREICDDPQALYHFFRRTQIEHCGQLNDAELAERLNAQTQVLCIVNTKKQAQQLFALLKPDGSYHLSTTLYPQHRKEQLQEIRNRLRDGLPCRVVATSLIEAGVDVDFPLVYRAQAGLDSVIQAAGRCNRENKRPVEESKVYVFEPDSAYRTPASQQQQIAAFSMAARSNADIAGLEAIADYFSKLYTIKGDSLDQKNILMRLEDGRRSASFPFAQLAKEVRLIEQETYPVLIPNCEEAEQCLARLKSGEHSRSLLRKAG